VCVNSGIKPSFRRARPKCGKKNQRFTHLSTLFSIGHARLFHQIPTFPQFKIHSLQVATIAARLRGHLQVVVSGAHHAVGLNYDTLCCWCAPDTTLGLLGSYLGSSTSGLWRSLQLASILQEPLRRRSAPTNDAEPLNVIRICFTI
jgi:hypothetical protein